MASTFVTILLALALIVCPAILPVYDSAGLDTEEILQTAEGITGIDYAQTAGYDTPAVPSPTPAPAQTASPTQTAQPTPTATPAATPAPTGTPAPSVEKAGAELIAGDWHGSKSLLFGAASADFSLSADSYGNMVISGTAEAPVAGYGETPFYLEAEWTYLGNNQFRGEAMDRTLDFTCNGTQIKLTANPYQLGFIDNSMADMDIDILLTRTA